MIFHLHFEMLWLKHTALWPGGKVATRTTAPRDTPPLSGEEQGGDTRGIWNHSGEAFCSARKCCVTLGKPLNLPEP